MKKQYYFIGVIMLGLFSSVSSAATQSFWAYGSNDSFDNPKYLNHTGPSTGKKSISIDYILGTNWTNISAKLWLKAVDDGYCASGTCVGQDPSEQALITKIEGIDGDYASKEIDAYGWYDLNLDVTSFLLHDIDSNFKGTVKVSPKADFIFENAKLVIDYDIKAVPVPAAIWLFGSALMGLTGISRRKLA